MHPRSQSGPVRHDRRQGHLRLPHGARQPTATWAPYLAESVEPNEDCTQWTITLRDGVTFHDGTALDATVVKNNIDAWLGRYPNRPSLFFQFVLDNIDTVEIVDDMTVSLTTKVPWPSLPAYLNGGGRLGIMAQAQLDDPETCDRELIGTGPYVLEEWRVNDSLSATRNPDYWATDARGQPAPVPRPHRASSPFPTPRPG